MLLINGSPDCHFGEPPAQRIAERVLPRTSAKASGCEVPTWPWPEAVKSCGIPSARRTGGPAPPPWHWLAEARALGPSFPPHFWAQSRLCRGRVVLWVWARLWASHSWLGTDGGGGGLVAKSCPTLAIPWTVARRAPLPWDFPGKNTGVDCHFLLRGSSQPRNRTRVSCIAGRFFTDWAMKEALGTDPGGLFQSVDTWAWSTWQHRLPHWIRRVLRPWRSAVSVGVLLGTRSAYFRLEEWDDSYQHCGL